MLQGSMIDGSSYVLFMPGGIKYTNYWLTWGGAHSNQSNGPSHAVALNLVHYKLACPAYSKLLTPNSRGAKLRECPVGEQ